MNEEKIKRLRRLWKSCFEASMKIQKRIDTIFFEERPFLLDPACMKSYIGSHKEEESELREQDIILYERMLELINQITYEKSNNTNNN